MRYVILLTIMTILLACIRKEKVIDRPVTDLSPASQPVQEPLVDVSESGDTEKIIPKNNPEQNKAVIPPNSIRMNIFKNTEAGGYGYDILMGEKLYIHQPNIPALPGNNGFASEESARKVAELVIYKIRNNIMPPTVEVKELDSLGVK